MTQAAHSEYIRYNQKSALIRRWIATVLLKSDLEGYLAFSGLEPIITRGFDTSSVNKDNREDPPFIRSWLKKELEKCGKESFDESDVFAINTRRIQKSMGLNKVELSVLRFACLVNCYKPLEAATEFGGNSFAEADLCDLLSELLCIPFSSIYTALQPSGLLRRSGLLRTSGGDNQVQHVTRWLRIPNLLAREIFRAQDNDNLLINVFYQTGPKSTLTQHDFPQRSELLLLKKYLRASIKENAVGANVLLWGPPGTGKTEMARHLAQSLRKKSLEINTIDSDNHSLTAADRLDCYRFCQAILARSSNAIVTFDEVEDILCDGNYSMWGFRGNSKFAKGLMNTILETNTTPAIWITNTVSGVDPAYLRRFDVVVNLKRPVARVKRRMASKAFKDLPLSKSTIDKIIQHHAITGAHMQKVSKICERIGVETAGEAQTVVKHVINGELCAARERPLATKATKKKGAQTKLPYRPALINCDTNIVDLADKLRPGASVRICSFGPPGTGKTAWARSLADKLQRPLLVKQAVDILDKYVGETEKNIIEIFKEAEATRSILVLDEIDSFLPDRNNLDRHWQVTQANQFLTAMEDYQGILVCTTNLKDSLDPATMRRFDFKITFDYLKADQACEVASDLMKVLDVKLSEKCSGQLRTGLAGLKLTHGDFAALLRRYAALGTKPDWRELAEDLKTETGFRKRESGPIGFLANLT